MSKRQKFVISSLGLSAGFLGIQLATDLAWRYEAIAGLAVLAILAFVWSLWGGLSLKDRPATLLTLILPGMFTAGVGLFYFLLPSYLLARLPVVIFFGLGVYALALTANIFTVAAIRTIQLARAAQAVNFVLSLITAFLLFDTIWSFRLPAYFNFLLVAFVSFPLLLHGFWSIQLEESLPSSVVQLAAFSAVALAELAIILSFWPASVVIVSLCLTTVIYVILGLGQAKLAGRLFVKTVKEHLFFGGLFLLIMFFTTNWRG